MNLTEMRELLAKRNIQLTKSLGQNFLHDGNQLRRIADAAKIKPTDKILEVGPGLGPLTELLLEKADEVLAVEMDGRLVEFLQERFGAQEQADEQLADVLTGQVQTGGAPKQLGAFHLLHADALGFLKREQRDWSDWKLVANLPYSVASPILVELSAGIRAPKKIVVTLQLEVAQRLMAAADDDHYGILTLLVQIDFQPREWFKIPPGCFFPSPDVDSACVVLERRPQPLLPENLRASFVKIVKRAFSQRRKMMMKLLKQDWAADKLAAAFAELNISPMERAEKLSLEQFVALTKILA
ncbi:MAG: rRNA ((1518)-N(6)/adenine(1519)-N(6))-dimethyltransferase RsmA [Verrucomicrobiota bacterium]|jgi:16S rRNA (adenine1518-N6/adenine1519-N6)-dimethyltransferase